MVKYHDCPVCGGAVYGIYGACELCGYEDALAYAWAHLHDEIRVIITYGLPWTLKKGGDAHEEVTK